MRSRLVLTLLIAIVTVRYSACNGTRDHERDAIDDLRLHRNRKDSVFQKNERGGATPTRDNLRISADDEARGYATELQKLLEKTPNLDKLRTAISKDPDLSKVKAFGEPEFIKLETLMRTNSIKITDEDMKVVRVILAKKRTRGLSKNQRWLLLGVVTLISTSIALAATLSGSKSSRI